MLRVRTRVAGISTLAEPGTPVQLKLDEFEDFQLWHGDGFNLLNDTDYLVAMTSDEFNKLDRILTEGPLMEGIKPPDTAKLLGSVYDFFWGQAVGGIGVTRESVAVQLTEIWAKANPLQLSGEDQIIKEGNKND